MVISTRRMQNPEPEIPDEDGDLQSQTPCHVQKILSSDITQELVRNFLELLLLQMYTCMLSVPEKTLVL